MPLEDAGGVGELVQLLDVIVLHIGPGQISGIRIEYLIMTKIKVMHFNFTTDGARVVNQAFNRSPFFSAWVLVTVCQWSNHAPKLI